MHNVHYTWTHFLQAFCEQYLDHAKQQCTGIKLETHKFRFLLINEYMAEFEDLTTLAGYTIGSAETINLFLKGLTSAPDVFDKVMDYPAPTTYHDLRTKAISVVKAQQLVNALKRTAAPIGRFVPQPFWAQNRPPAPVPSRPAPRFPQYNSTNAPRWMNNIPVPMDLSRGRAPFNRRGGQPQNQGQWRGARGNVAQTEQQPPRTKGPCFKCGKQGHFT